MQSLFEYEAHPRDVEAIFFDRYQDLGKKIGDDSFAYHMFKGVLANLKQIKIVINQYAPEWPIDKIDPVERVILYIGVYELIFVDDAPKAVVINEGIELAKTYADENSNKFINGVLNAVANSEEKKISLKNK